MTKEVLNERIKELAKTYLSHERFGPDGESTIEDYYEFYPEELQKFIELVVHKCIQIAHKETDDSVRLETAIQAYFGVEE